MLDAADDHVVFPSSINAFPFILFTFLSYTSICDFVYSHPTQFNSYKQLLDSATEDGTVLVRKRQQSSL